MLDRLSPRSVINAHCKALTNRDYARGGEPVTTPDRASRAVAWGTPVVVIAAMLIFGGRLPSPGAVLTMFGLLSAALFMAFTRVTGWREILTAREELLESVEMARRDLLDEVAANIMVTLYLAVLTDVVTVIGMNAQTDPTGAVVGISAAIIAALSAWTVVMILLVLPGLYDAYEKIVRVRPGMAGSEFGSRMTHL